MPRDRRCEPLFLGISELLAENGLQIVDAELDFRSVVKPERILRAKEIHRREVIMRYRLGLDVAAAQVLEPSRDTDQPPLHHLPCFG